jgi:hypothetical protein
VSFRKIFSATSALALMNFPPPLSWVVDQITSPCRFTSRTDAEASCFRSLLWLDSFCPIFKPLCFSALVWSYRSE